MVKSYHHGDLKNALIQAGITVLSQEGISALSLRKVASVAGVSHAAPYAHFTDKQALVAAISTAGYTRLYEKLAAAVQQYEGNPLRQLVEAAWAYVDFATTETAHFKIVTSGVVAKEQDYPELVAITRRNFALIVQVVTACQASGVLRAGPPELMAVSVWGAIHGLVTLILEGQVSHLLLEQYGLRGMLIFTLNQITLVTLEEN
jgi:AcrR family transcriptional regulator